MQAGGQEFDPPQVHAELEVDFLIQRNWIAKFKNDMRLLMSFFNAISDFLTENRKSSLTIM